MTTANTSKKRKRFTQVHSSDADFHWTLYGCTLVARCILFRLPPENIAAMLSLTKKARATVLGDARTLEELLRTFYPYAAVPDMAVDRLAVFCTLSRRRLVRSEVVDRVLLGPRHCAYEISPDQIVVNAQWPLKATRRVYTVAPAYREGLLNEARLAEEERMRLESGMDLVEYIEEDFLATHATRRRLRQLDQQNVDRLAFRLTIEKTLGTGADNGWVDTLSLLGTSVRVSPFRATALHVGSTNDDGQGDVDLTTLATSHKVTLRASTGRPYWHASGYLVTMFSDNLALMGTRRRDGTTTDTPNGTAATYNVVRFLDLWRAKWRVIVSNVPGNFFNRSFDDVTRMLYLLTPSGVNEIDLSDEADATVVFRPFSTTAFTAGPNISAVCVGPLFVDVGYSSERTTAGVVTTIDFRNVNTAGCVVVHRYRPRIAAVDGSFGPMCLRQVHSVGGSLLLKFAEVNGYHYPQFLARPMPWERGRPKDAYRRLK